MKNLSGKIHGFIEWKKLAAGCQLDKDLAGISIASINAHPVCSISMVVSFLKII